MELQEHKIEHPDIVEVARLKLETTTLNTLLVGLNSKFNFVNLDIQGAELLALKGLSNHMAHVNYIYSEVNTKELYKGCALLPELDAFLATHGFIRTDIDMTRHGWGDALYIRRAI